MDHSRVSYRVIPEQRKVIARISDCQYDALDMINNRFLPIGCSSLAVVVDENSKHREKFLMRKSFTATVKCHEEDEFDIEKGKELALAKLADKYHASLNRHLVHYLLKMEKGLHSIDEYMADRFF